MEVFLAAAGGTWFAIFVLLIFILGIATSEFDSFFGGMITLIIGLLGLDFIFGYPIIQSIIGNPLIILLSGAIYIAIGSAYTAIWKWPDYIRSKSDNIESNYKSWKKRRLSDNEPCTFEDFLESDGYSYYVASNNKNKLSTWVLMWPFSMFWEVSRKPAIWAFNTSYKMLGNMFEIVGKNTARKIHKTKK